MIKKLVIGLFVGAATGAVIGYPMLGTIPAALGLGSSVTAIIWGAQFGFTPQKNHEEQ